MPRDLSGQSRPWGRSGVFGHPLSYARAERGWSQHDLAEALRRLAGAKEINLATTKNRVWRWEHHDATPDRATQFLLAELFDVPGEIVRLHPWPLWLPAWGDVPLAFAWSREGSLQAVADAADRARDDSRGFPGLSGVPLAAVGCEWLVMEPERLRGALGGRGVDRRVVGWLESRVARLRRLDDVLGGGGLRALADEELRLAFALLRQGTYTAPTERRLLIATADLAQLAGWVSVDAGFHGAGQRYYVAALHAAHAAGDGPLGAYVLASMSYQLAQVGDPREATRLAVTARDGARRSGSPAIRAMLDFRLAQAHAAAGEASPCRQALAATERVPGTGDRPPWLYWLSDAQGEAFTGACLLRLGDSAARPALERAAAGHGPTFVRDRAVHLALLAEAFLREGDVEAACHQADSALTLATQVSSQRVTATLRDLRRGLAPFGDTPSVRTLAERFELVAGDLGRIGSRRRGTPGGAREFG
ncbi:MAG: hypothetical protein ACRDN9_02340 [Streptosporangiaceae bacterium]